MQAVPRPDERTDLSLHGVPSRLVHRGLYGLFYTLKFLGKHRVPDYVTCALGGPRYAGDMGAYTDESPDGGLWTTLIIAPSAPMRASRT